MRHIISVVVLLCIIASTNQCRGQHHERRVKSIGVSSLLWAQIGDCILHDGRSWLSYWSNDPKDRIRARGAVDSFVRLVECWWLTAPTHSVEIIADIRISPEKSDEIQTIKIVFPKATMKGYHNEYSLEFRATSVKIDNSLANPSAQMRLNYSLKTTQKGGLVEEYAYTLSRVVEFSLGKRGE